MNSLCRLHKVLLPAAALSAALMGVSFGEEPMLTDIEAKKLAGAYTTTGLDLFDQLAEKTGGNLVLSPFSIGTALAMAYAGARTTTEAEMSAVLGFAPGPDEIGRVNQHLVDMVVEPTSENDASIEIANALHLTRFGGLVSDGYTSLLQKDFDAELFSGSGLEQINAWVSDKTNGKITEILKKLDPNSVAVLLNAIHFSATWQAPFSETQTDPGDFHLSPYKTISVPMMHQALSLRMLSARDYDAIALPYAGGRMEMVVFLPMVTSENGQVSIKLDGDDLARVIDQLDLVTPKHVALTLPKFSFESGANLVPLLQGMGLDLAFDRDNADFSGVTGSSDETSRIHISQVEHKALIDVNESGTEAAAATAVEFAARGVAPQAMDDVTIDRPFLFAIVERGSGTVLFMGRVSDPSNGAATSTDDIGESEPIVSPQDALLEMLAPTFAVESKTMIASMPARQVGGGNVLFGSGDQFAGFSDGRTLTVLAEPVSTFSIDVDTAAYSYVRRMLEAGTLPQADAVRIEEMINYFDYGYAGPDGMEKPFSIHTNLFPTPWRDGTQLLQIGIQGYRVPAESRPPANIVLLIDTSGSMEAPDKLPLLKKSFELLLGQLTEKDTVSIVAYAGSAGVVLEPTKASNKVKIRAALNELHSGGSTAGAEGIELAYQLAAEADTAAGTNRVILATDGDFNVGIDDPDDLKRFIAKKRDSGIFLSVLGFGSGNLDDETMQALAQNGNGTAAYIDSFAEARKVLSEEVGASLQTIARDVKIQVEFNPAVVAEYRLIGYETRLLNSEDFNNDAVDAGDIGSGHAVTALYEITPVGSAAQLNDPLRYGDDAPTPDMSGEAAFVKLRYKPGDADTSQLISLPVRIASAAATFDAAPEAARFAAAVAGFGQKLRDNPATAGWDWAQLKALAKNARGTDENGYRAEMVRLIDLAEALSE